MNEREKKVTKIKKIMTERPSLAFSPEFSIFPSHLSLDTIVVPGGDRGDRGDDAVQV